MKFDKYFHLAIALGLSLRIAVFSGALQSRLHNHVIEKALINE